MAFNQRLKPQTAVQTINNIGGPCGVAFGVQLPNGDHTVTLTHCGVAYHGRAANRKAAKEIAARKAVRGYFTTDIKVPGRLMNKMNNDQKELAAYALGQLIEKWRNEGYTVKPVYIETAEDGAGPAPRAPLGTLRALAALRALATLGALAAPSTPAAAGWQYFDDD